MGHCTAVAKWSINGASQAWLLPLRHTAPNCARMCQVSPEKNSARTHRCQPLGLHNRWPRCQTHDMFSSESVPSALSKYLRKQISHKQFDDVWCIFIQAFIHFIHIILLSFLVFSFGKVLPDQSCSQVPCRAWPACRCCPRGKLPASLWVGSLTETDRNCVLMM